MKVEIEFFDINEFPPPETNRPLLVKAIVKTWLDELAYVQKVGFCKFGCKTYKDGRRGFQSYVLFDPIPSHPGYSEGGVLWAAPQKGNYTVTHWAYFNF